MVTLDRGLEEAAALLHPLARRKGADDESTRIKLAILAVERARALLVVYAETLVYHDDW
jgi:hypothetical protein